MCTPCGSVWQQINMTTEYNESIWEVEFIGTRLDNNYTESRIGNTIGNAQRNGNATGKGYTYAFYAGTLVLWDLFEKNSTDKTS